MAVAGKILRVQPNFVPAVLHGLRKVAIVRGRKYQAGQRLYLFPVGRGKERLRSTSTTEVQDIHINGNGVVILDNRVLCEYERDMLVIDAGFKSFQHFMQFYKQQRLPLKGQLVRWL